MKPNTLVYAVTGMISVALAGFIGLTVYHAFAQIGQLVTRLPF